MRKFYILVISIGLLALSGKSQAIISKQDVSKDTANFPYWVQMMQDPTVNFFKVQRAFNIYWQNRPITKGCGWKVFKSGNI